MDSFNYWNFRATTSFEKMYKLFIHALGIVVSGEHILRISSGKSFGSWTICHICSTSESNFFQICINAGIHIIFFMNFPLSSSLKEYLLFSCRWIELWDLRKSNQKETTVTFTNGIFVFALRPPSCSFCTTVAVYDVYSCFPTWIENE